MASLEERTEHCGGNVENGGPLTSTDRCHHPHRAIHSRQRGRGEADRWLRRHMQRRVGGAEAGDGVEG